MIPKGKEKYFFYNIVILKQPWNAKLVDIGTFGLNALYSQVKKQKIYRE